MEQTHNNSSFTWRSLALLGMTIVFVLAFALIPGTGFAYTSSICDTDPCSEESVGPFMKDISKTCGNSGNCSLNDIMQVFVNVGNYVVGIIGFVVLLMYVIGGFYWLASAGRKEWVDKGKKYMTISTVGLLIVMFSYLAIQALKSALQTGDIASKTYVTCSGTDTIGDACDAGGAKCDETGFTCVYE